MANKKGGPEAASRPLKADRSGESGAERQGDPAYGCNCCQYVDAAKFDAFGFHFSCLRFLTNRALVLEIFGYENRGFNNISDLYVYDRTDVRLRDSNPQNTALMFQARPVEGCAASQCNTGQTPDRAVDHTKRLQPAGAGTSDRPALPGASNVCR